ncbi:MAG: hypothetical protein K2Q25_10615 [Mycobacteriaceae bacterium]|nr:hypothetical protein [Mycobacteriaceae bacterium]
MAYARVLPPGSNQAAVAQGNLNGTYDFQDDLDMANARVWFEIVGGPEASRKPAAPASSLSQLVAIAAVAEATTLAAAQGGMHSEYGSLSIQISAATTEAAVLAKAGKLNLYAMTGYLYEVIAIIEALEAMNGFGSPYAGDAFQDGGTSFAEDINYLLQSATATDWSGEGAEEYNKQNKKQQDHTITIANADQRANSVLTDQAFQVEQGRQGLAGTRLAVFGAITVAWIIIKIILSTGFTAAAASLYQLLRNFVERVSYVAASTAFGLIINLLIQGIQNGQHLESTIRKYKSVYNDALANITALTPQATALATSRLPA